jgi:hypothetical protein
MFESENRFIAAVQKRFDTGSVGAKDIADLNQFAITCRVSPERAAQIIDQVRRNSSKVQSSKGNEFLEQQMSQELIAALSQNQVEVLKRRMPALKNLASNTQDATINYLHYMLQASMSPEISTIDILNANTDNYWQIFWAYVAYTKVGDMDKATALLPRLGAFGGMQGDMSLLMALSNVAEFVKHGNNDYYKGQAQQHLEQSMAAGMSSETGAIVLHVKDINAYQKLLINSMTEVVVPGYAAPMEFYAPDYAVKNDKSKKDNRTTIAWIPSLQSNSSGDASVSFWTADRPSNYRVVIEGITSEGELLHNEMILHAK